MDILVVDDEPLARARLRRLLEGEPDYRVVAEAGSADEALAATLREDPEVVLLDIQMPGDSGLQAAQRLARLEDPPALIFCTAYEEHALEAFDVNASDYLLKPVRRERLLAALAQASRLNRAQRQQLREDPARPHGRAHVSARSRKGVELIPIEDVFYFSADQKYVTVFHRGGETLLDDTLKELEREFEGRFVRVHRNALVPVERIEAMEKLAAGQYCLRLRGTERRPQVSRRHAAGVRALLASL